MQVTKPYVYDATSRVLYIDLIFWEGLSANDKLKIVELSEGNFPDTIGEHVESFALVIRGDATNEKHQETFTPVIANVNRVCGSLYNRN